MHLILDKLGKDNLQANSDFQCPMTWEYFCVSINREIEKDGPRCNKFINKTFTFSEKKLMEQWVELMIRKILASMGIED